MLSVVDNTAKVLDFETTEGKQQRPGDAIETAIDAIASDARVAPMAYAKETVMPEGGE